MEPLTYTNFRRDGKMRNGRYPDSSYGKGIRHQFTDITVKGGLTYKFNGRHMLTANISYGSEAPLPNEGVYLTRITDRTIDNMKSGRIFSADLNYVFSMPNWLDVSVFSKPISTTRWSVTVITTA